MIRAPERGRAPLLVMAHGFLGAPHDASFRFAVESSTGRAACAEPVTEEHPCRLAVPAGAIRAIVGGDVQMSDSLQIPPRGGTVNINYPGRSLLWWGLGTTLAGAVGIGIGVGTDSLGGKIGGFMAGGMAATVGLSLLLAHAIVSGAGTRISFDESSH
jgi:hypothetical protein